jgi:hypothetical protein
MEPTTPINLFDLQFDSQSGAYLGEAARWARFLAILGFIGTGLLVIIGVFMGTTMSGALSSMGVMGGLGGGMIAVIYILMALLYFFPCLYLFRFGSGVRTATRNNDQQSLVSSLKNLKSCFKYFGVLSIIIMSLYALAIIAMVIGGFAGRH